MLLGERRLGTKHGGQQCTRCREPIRKSLHSCLPPSACYCFPISDSQNLSMRACQRSTWRHRSELLVEPKILKSVAVVDAVDHDRHALKPRLPAMCRAGVE